MKKSDQFQKRNACDSQPRFCSCCGFQFPSLPKPNQTQYRFCTNCGKPVQGGGHQWTNIRVDDQGVLHADESIPNRGTTDQPQSKYVQFLAHTPAGVVISGVALAALGYGFILAAVPLVAAGAAIAGTGATIVQTAVVGGMIMGLVVAFTGDGEAMKGVLMLSGAVALGGVSMLVAGCLMAALAGIMGVLGTALIAVGSIAVGAVGCHQLYLHNRKQGWTRRAREAISGKTKEDKSIAGESSPSAAADPWAGLDKMTLEANIMDALRKGSQN